MVADHFIVRLSQNASRAALEAVVAQFGGSIRRAIPNSELYLVKTPELSRLLKKDR
jgi:hypothetical protein